MILKSEIKLPELMAKIKWYLVNGGSAVFNKLGLYGCVSLACLLIILGLQFQKNQTLNRLNELHQWQTQDIGVKAKVKKTPIDGHTKVKAFKKALLPYHHISGAVQDMLQMASKQGLINVKGKYKATVDVNGGFLRYQMVIPVKGDIKSINQYIKDVFFAQKTLALKSIKFNRKNINSLQIEARIQWVLFTQLPSEGNKK